MFSSDDGDSNENYNSHLLGMVPPSFYQCLQVMCRLKSKSVKEMVVHFAKSCQCFDNVVYLNIFSSGLLLLSPVTCDMLAQCGFR